MRKLMRNTLLCFWLTGGLIAGSAAAESIKVPPIETLQSRYDIAGVRLGMSVEQVRTLMARRGFVIQYPKVQLEYGCDWACELSAAVAERKLTHSDVSSKGLIFAHFSGPRGQIIEVNFAPSPVGQVVRMVRYGIPRSQITKAAFKAQASAKFGPLYGPYQEILYCFDIEPDCGDGDGSRNLFPSIGGGSANLSQTGIDPAAYNHLTLYEGSFLGERRDRQLRNAVNAAAPQDAKPAF